MNTTLIKKEIKLPEFSNNYVADLLDFCLLSGRIDKENYEDILLSYSDNMNDYLIGIANRNNYILVDNKDCERLFANVNYMVGFYIWHNKFELDIFISKMWRPFELLKEAENYYFEVLKNVSDRILKLKDNNKIEMYSINAFFERLCATVERYKDLVRDLISELDLGYGILQDKDNKFRYFGKYEMFDLLSNAETRGFVNFINAISELEYQFEFYSLFNPKKIKRVYDNLLFDVVVGIDTKPQKYTNLLRPVLQQFLFCCEYSDEDAVKLSLRKEDVIFVFEDLKTKYMKDIPKVREFYKATDEKISKIFSEISEDYKISEFYNERLDNLRSCFFYDKKTFGNDFKVAAKDTFERAVREIKSKKMYEKNKEATDKIISKLTEEETKYYYTEMGIVDSYLEYLKSALKNNEAFKSLSDNTREYILNNIPDVRNSLMAFFLYNKNISFYVE